MESQKYRNQGHEVYWNANDGGKYDKIITKEEGLPFLGLPRPDREFTNARADIYQRNGNFKYHPATYIMSASGCWHGACSFCVEKEKKYEVRPVEDVISEIEEIKSQGYVEVFDDSATLPRGEWLNAYITQLSRIFKRDTGSIRFGANARCVDYPFGDMYNVGFRMLLFGVESANQKTLDRINKGVQVEDIKYIIKASKAGLEPHICVVFGWEWESEEDALNTLKLVHYLLRKGYAKTAQASFISQHGFKSNESQRPYIHRIYDVAYSPEFWFNQLKDIRDINDIKYLWKKIRSAL
jgi:radical SAM superfamily enzyme YgiQ (UPF0313 family)